LRAILLILPFLCLSCIWKQKSELKDQEIIEALKDNDQQLESPREGQWLYVHPEPGQTLNQYKAIKPVLPTSKQHKIYLLPIGLFSKPQEDVIQYTADYLQIFFGLETIVLQPLSDQVIPNTARRVRNEGSVQLLAPYILNRILKGKIPEDAIALMAITEKDLYPNPSWQFVFGLATLKEKIGVSSIYRYSKEPIDSLNYPVCLERLIKTSSHEIGHMFSMLHCTQAVCVMNGSNGLRESDAHPNRLCSVCLKKLHWNIKFDVRKRLHSLDSFFLIHRLQKDQQLIKKDLYIIQ
jgi:archaemetzincin